MYRLQVQVFYKFIFLVNDFSNLEKNLILFLLLKTAKSVLKHRELFIHLFTHSLIQSVSRSVGQSVSRSVGQSVSRSVGQLVRRSVIHSVRRSLGHLVVRPSVRPSVRLSVRPFVQPFVRPSIRPSVYPSIHLFVHLFVQKVSRSTDQSVWAAYLNWYAPSGGHVVVGQWPSQPSPLTPLKFN
jgi:hypothetical protein